MCTASWGTGIDSDGLIFNRDEQRSRSKAKLPNVFFHNETKVIAPIDEKGGGTWIAVNEYGFGAALLNNYGAETRGPVLEGVPRSRGFAPLAFMDCVGVEEAAARWVEFDKGIYRPFLLLFWDRSVRLFSWDGLNSREIEWQHPLATTSSFATDEVEAYRSRLFGERIVSVSSEKRDRLNGFHLDESHTKPAFNPLMSREDAITHSVSRVRLEGDEVVFNYWDRDFVSEKLSSPIERRMKLRLPN